MGHHWLLLERPPSSTVRNARPVHLLVCCLWKSRHEGLCFPAACPLLLLLLVMLLVGSPVAKSHRGFCPVACRCNEDQLVARCTNASLDVIPITLNPALRELLLSHNAIKNIFGSFSVYDQLVLLDVSHNHLKNLNKNNFRLRHLRRLDLSHNSVDEVSTETFEGLQNLQELNLRNNKLTSLIARSFHDMRNLEVFDLSHNRLCCFAPTAFVGLVRLRKLVLRSNFLQRVPSDTFSYLPHLHTLDCGANAIRVISDDAFRPLNRLHELYLDHCELISIEPYGFRGLISLLGLSVQYNALDAFPAHAFLELRKLETLDIGGNLLPHLDSGDLGGLPALRKFDLSDSDRLTRIAGDAFEKNPNIEQIYIERNKQLEQMPEQLFSSLRLLRHVSLRGNALRSIPAAAVPLDRLESFDVSDNPLVCNCSIEWLWTLLTRLGATSSASLGQNYQSYVEAMPMAGNVSATRCEGGPSALRTVLLKDLSWVDLDCDGPARRNLLIACVATACLLSASVSLAVVVWCRRRAKLILDAKENQMAIAAGGCEDVVALTVPFVTAARCRHRQQHYDNGNEPPHGQRSSPVSRDKSIPMHYKQNALDLLNGASPAIGSIEKQSFTPTECTELSRAYPKSCSVAYQQGEQHYASYPHDGDEPGFVSRGLSIDDNAAPICHRGQHATLSTAISHRGRLADSPSDIVANHVYMSVGPPTCLRSNRQLSQLTIVSATNGGHGKHSLNPINHMSPLVQVECSSSGSPAKNHYYTITTTTDKELHQDGSVLAYV